MSRGMKWILTVTLLAALAVTAVLGAGILRDRRRVRELTAQLAESRARWEDIAERKETLQAELKTVEEALKEANLTIEESETRAEELREDIARLEAEIEALKKDGENAETIPGE
ncbi:MAG: hypothetical protein II888_03985 [Clostridia bacterium]|nr:hypothetical protein [Clostridia bacterium]